MGVLCLSFSAFGQENRAVDVTAKGIQIGQALPDVAITNIHNYKDKDGKPATTANLSDFRGKLLILDFWATWCSPCVAMIPKMDSLQKVFGDKVQFLSVTYQSEKEVLPFLEKFEKQRGKHYDLPIVTSSKELHKLFPHTTLPHYVWVDGGGVVNAITGHEEVNAENIRKAVVSSVELVQKRDMKVAYDIAQPLLINGNGGEAASLRYHTMLTGYLDGLSQGYSVTTIADPKGRKVTSRNQNIISLFALAYGGDSYYFGKNRILLNTTQDHLFRSGKNLRGEPLRKWMADGHAFCYEVQVQPGQGKSVFEIMKRDLAVNFPMFDVKVVNKKTKCLVLVRTSERDKLVTTGGQTLNQFTPMECKLVNSTLSVFLSRLEMLYLYKLPPLVDTTEYSGYIDLALNCNLSNVVEINRELARYDLQLVEQETETELLSITDSPVNGSGEGRTQ